MISHILLPIITALIRCCLASCTCIHGNTLQPPWFSSHRQDGRLPATLCIARPLSGCRCSQSMHIPNWEQTLKGLSKFLWLSETLSELSVTICQAFCMRVSFLFLTYCLFIFYLGVYLGVLRTPVKSVCTLIDSCMYIQ